MLIEGRTNRLILRPLAMDDADAIQELFPHWEIVRYLQNRVPWPYPVDGAERFCRETALPQMASGEAWHWTLRLKAGPGRMIGMISLVAGESDHRGFWLGLPWHGRGLMSEACIWVTDYWFETLGFPRLRVEKATDNLASRLISKKQGMRRVGTGMKDYVCGTRRSETWEISAEEWQAWKARHLRPSNPYAHPAAAS